VKVLLVSMPFASVERPVLALSLLKSEFLEAGIECDVQYLSVAFADLLGRAAYDRIAEYLPHFTLAGEWVFAECLYGPGQEPSESYPEAVLRSTWSADPDAIECVLSARARAPDLLSAAMSAIPWRNYDVVGFSSSNAENLAALALAKLVRERYPSAVIIFGGANWQGAMGVELLSRFPFVDMAFLGEADRSFPEVLRRLATDRDAALDDVPGLALRNSGVVRTTAPPEPVEDLDSLPTPDHADFFAALDYAPRARWLQPAAPMESSRGCWWAEGRPCGFCGLDDVQRVYRTKSPARILSELRELAFLWHGSRISLVDNVVSSGFLAEVLPQLVEDRPRLPLFFDIRPDVTREDVRRMGALQAHVQPGIESFSDHVLRLMGKGSRGLENVRLLKWCRESGVTAHWNVIRGLPGETARDYDDMLAMLPSIRFLCPPRGCGPVNLDRYSLFCQEAQSHGFHDVEPLAVYRYLYPFPERALRRIAYSFSYRRDPPGVDDQRARRLDEEVSTWEEEYSTGALWMTGDDGATVRLLDERPGAEAKDILLEGLDRLLYMSCDSIASRQALLRLAAGQGSDAPDCVDERLTRMLQRRLMVTDGERYLSLGLVRDEPTWSDAASTSVCRSACDAPSSANTSAARLMQMTAADES